MSPVALALVALLHAPGAAAPAQVQDAVHDRDEPATLVVWHREIVVFRATYRDQTPARRVASALDRLENVSLGADWNVEVLPATVGDLTGFVVDIDGATIFGLVEEDLDSLAPSLLEDAAEQAAQRLREVVEARRSARRWPVLLKGIGLSGLATMLFLLLLRLLGRTVGVLVDRLPRLLPRFEFSWRLWGVDLSGSLRELRVFLLRLVSLVVGLSLTYLWLTFVLAQFPYTQPWSEELGGLLLEGLGSFGEGAMNAIPGLFLVFIVFSVTKMAARLIGSFFTAVERGSTQVSWLEPETAKATRRIVIVLVWLFALMFAYPHIPGSGTVAFKGISVFIGLLVTVGSTGLVNQVMSGLVVLFSRTLKAGDYVQIAEDEGMVVEVGFLSTRIATPKQEEIIIPNAVLTGKTTRNLSRISRENGVVADTTVTIGYDTPWRQVVDLLVGAAGRTKDVRAEPAPFVLQRSLSDFYVEYELIFHLQRPDIRARVLSDLHQEIQDGFNDAGVQIMSPHFREQPEESVVVPRERWGTGSSPAPEA